MPMKPLAGLFLALACVLGIASTGCVFELAYGEPDLGVSTTRLDLGGGRPRHDWNTCCSDSVEQTGLMGRA